MSLLTRAGDLVYTFRFLKLLVTPFDKTTAFKLGIIDEAGKRIKAKPIKTSEEKSAYNAFHRLVFNIKKLIPGGKVGSYAAALFLLKETYKISDQHMDRILKESGMEVADLLTEQSEWFIIEGNKLSPGIYRVKEEKLLNSTLEDIVFKFDKVRVTESNAPVGEVFGIPVYEAIHMPTLQPIYVTTGELVR
jgi:hypothetical protein